eukprot:13899657-Alexandrium_andersonii.AAC.1
MGPRHAGMHGARPAIRNIFWRAGPSQPVCIICKSLGNVCFAWANRHVQPKCKKQNQDCRDQLVTQ